MIVQGTPLPFVLYHIESIDKSRAFDKSIDPIGTPTTTALPEVATITPALTEQGNFRLGWGVTQRGKTTVFVKLVVTPMPPSGS